MFDGSSRLRQRGRQRKTKAKKWADPPCFAAAVERGNRNRNKSNDETDSSHVHKAKIDFISPGVMWALSAIQGQRSRSNALASLYIRHVKQ